ncbi:tricalbin-1 [Colletotrichum liriopes]|uniref:Tricalbin-1 n=1 Tax=Colletotrichum liriopes TaxID=708192 RepID=A0AA37GFV1_9PEZI|nr:tricalbin-1 [Colletotrichum liriopes]
MASALEKNELKVQGVVESAQDPETNVSADDAQKKIVEESKKAGITAFTFDPDASPEEKRRQAAAAVPAGFHSQRAKGVSIVTDVADSSAPVADLPSPTKEGVIELAKDKDGKPIKTGEDPEGDEEEPYTRTGWAPQFGWPADDVHEGASLLDHSTWLESNLPDKFYGDWYHNAAIIGFACISSWLVAVLGGGLGWVFILMAACSTYYRTSIRRVRRNFRDDINRELSLKKLETETESLEWINSFMLKFWPIYQPVLAQTIVNSVDQVLSSATPAFLDSLKLKTFTLGSKPPRMEHVKTYPKAGDDTVIMDWKFSFTPNDTADMTYKQIKNKINPKVVLEIRVGKAMISKGLDVIVEDMAFSGTMQLKIKLQIPFPHIEKAIGVLAVTLHGAQGLKNPDNFSGSPDPYAALTLNRRQQLARTKHIKDTGNPRWNETHYIIITSFNDSLDIQIFDYNDFRKHKELGVASFPLDQVEELAVHENEVLEVIADGKARGQLSCDIRFFPVLEPKKLDDGTLEPPPESNTGILRFTVEQAKDLDGTKSLVGLLNPYATLHLNGRDVHHTKKLKRTNNPIWDNGSKEMLITDKKNAKLGVTIKDDRDLTGDQVIGKYQIKLEDMLECMEKSQEWFHLAGVATGRVKMMAQWKPVALSGVVGGTGGYVTPVGVMRFHFKNARDLRNFETLGKSDPYVRVLLSGIEKARTVTHKNTLDPDFDEVLYVPVHSARERLTLEVMDSEKMGKDRSLGLVEVFAGDYISQAENGEYNVHDTKKVFQGGLQLHGKGIAKGVLTYTVSFFPCLNVADPEDEEEQEQAAAAEKAIEDAPRSAEAGKFNSSIEQKKDGAELEISPPKTPVTPVSPSFPRKSKDESGPPKIRLSPQELLKYESGLLIFKLMEAEMPEHNTHLEVWVDDMAFPSYTSSAAKHKKHTFEEIGDCFIRELDFSRLTLKVREKGDKVEGSEKDKDHTIAKLQGNTLDTLKQCLNNPTTLKLKDKENRPSSVKVSLKYIPVKMQLDPSESINNMGTLRVDVLDAQDLPSADSNGKSDPYCKFELNGEDVYKTKVQKKTLHPAWNEFFEVPVPSRTAAKFKVTVWDYDFADKPDFLGAAEINLEQLDPFRPSESRLLLDGKSGTVRLRMLFRPSYVTRTRQGTSTFSGTFAAPGRIVTGIAGAPIKVGSTVGHGVGRGASFLKRGLFSRKDDDSNDASSSFTEIPTIVENGNSPPAPTPGLGLKRATGFSTDGSESPDTRPGTSNGSTLGHTRTKSNGAASVHSVTPGSPGSGTASFTVVSATGFPPSTDLYITINQLTPKPKVIGKTKHHKDATGFFRYNESFKCTCTPDTQFKIEAKGEHTLRSDDDLGEALYFVGDSGAGGEKEIKVGSGTVVMRSTFVPSASALEPDSPKAIVRRSFMGKRESRSREGTPS